MKTTTVLGLGVLGFAVLALLTIVLAGRWIKDDLAERSEQRLEAAGLTGIEVQIDGRDALLTGADAAEDAETAEKALEVVQGIWGVREARHNTN